MILFSFSSIQLSAISFTIVDHEIMQCSCIKSSRTNSDLSPLFGQLFLPSMLKRV
jgi:hypothetical protein